MNILKKMIDYSLLGINQNKDYSPFSDSDLVTYIATFIGKGGSGKTLTSLTFVPKNHLSLYNIYSNFEIKYKGKSIVRRLQTFDDLLKIKYEPNKRSIVFLDEGGVNMNSRNSMTNSNKIVNEFQFQQRKVGVELFLTTGQRTGSIDKNTLDMRDFNVDFFPYFMNGRKNFKLVVQKRSMSGSLIHHRVREFDGIYWLNRSGLSYDTKELAKINKI